MVTFGSILFKNKGDPEYKEKLQTGQPSFFIDLNLDQVIHSITSGKEIYDLKPFFYTPLHDEDSVLYRQEVMKDLENPKVLDSLNAFSISMENINLRLDQLLNLHYKYHKERWFLDVVKQYCEAVNLLASELSSFELKSDGMKDFLRYLQYYIRSDSFISLSAEINEIIDELSAIHYDILIKDLRVQVLNNLSNPDYTESVKVTFKKFRQGVVQNYLVKYSHSLNLNFVESQILEGVATLFPSTFSKLEKFSINNRDFPDNAIRIFHREIQFYITYIDYISVLKDAGLKFCYPQVSEKDKEIYSMEGFDLALAHKLVGEKQTMVCNDFYLKNDERILVISGPNQGGKTTFSRTFGQLHYFASLGCPVPGNSARLFLFDQLFTHYEKEEKIQNLQSKLEDDLVRIFDIIKDASADSIIIMNEILTSTTLQDAIFLSKKIMEKIIRIGALCVWVTFIDELSVFSKETVSMVSQVNPENPALRTFKIERRPANGKAFAISIAEKYQLTIEQLRYRIKL